MAASRLTKVAGFLALAACWLPGCVFYLKPNCTDTIEDGDESDVDCGGVCGACTIGQGCNSGADCDTGICTEDRCAPRPCENGVRDGQETDVDCGGGTCRPCSGGRSCVQASDCYNMMCAQNTCYARTVSFADPVAYECSYKPYYLRVADFNRDGHADLAVANELASTITVHLGKGDGTFTRVPKDYPTGDYPTGMVHADFNRDGILDLATADYHGDTMSILLGVGDGTFLDPVHYEAGGDGAETAHLSMGDLNGDGVQDLAAVNPMTDNVSIYLAKGDGTFSPATNIPTGKTSGPFSSTMGDWNGDGKVDLAIANLGLYRVSMMLGNGDGSFGTPVDYSVKNGDAATFLITADMNVDGKPDVVSANRRTGNVSVFPSRGDGTFGPALTSPVGETDAGPYFIAPADFNLDGVPDLVTVLYMRAAAVVSFGIGDGRFDPPVPVGMTGMAPFSLGVGDFNEDQKIDVVVGNAVSNNVSVFLNTSR